MSKKNFDLWDSDDEKVKSVRQKNIFDFDEEDDDSVVDLNALKLSSKAKKGSLFGESVGAVSASTSSKKNVLFDNDDDGEIPVKTSPIVVTQPKSDTPKSAPLLFDGDDDETPIKVSTKTTKPTKAHNLFSDEDDDTPSKDITTKRTSPATTPSTIAIDYERLYNDEKTLRLALEQTVTRLHHEIASLEQQLHKLSPQAHHTEPTVTFSAVNETHNTRTDEVAPEITESYEIIDEPPEAVSSTNTSNNTTDNWEKLANEEKERKQRQRAMKSKPRPVSMSAKRLNATKIQSVVGDVEHAAVQTETTTNTTANSATNSANNSQKSVAWDESSSGSESESNLKRGSDKTTTKHTSNHNSAENVEIPVTQEPIELTPEEIEAAAAQAHWESLAAMDRERKASARRHRPAPGARPKSLKSAINTPITNTTNTTTSISPIPHSVSGANIVGMVGGSTTQPTSAARPYPNNSNGRKVDDIAHHSDDSGWDSNDEEEEESEVENEVEEASPVERHTANNTYTNSKNSSANSITNNSTNNTNKISPEIESEIDTRLMEWVRSCRGNISSLLQTVHNVYRGGSLPDLSDIWGPESGAEERNDPAKIRKAYLKIVRSCHPDKQSHLDPAGGEFLEASRVFTIISDAYNRYKTSSGGV